MKRKIASGIVNVLVFFALWRVAQWLAPGLPVTGAGALVSWAVLAALVPASFLRTRLLVDWLTEYTPLNGNFLSM